jgi:single-strand DNA-binding protein
MSYANINRVVLVGRLTTDPELRAMPGGRSVCALRIACNGIRRDAEGAYEQRPNYFDVRTYGAQAENVHRYLRKGARVAIDGRLEWREWETPEQQRRQTVRVVAEAIQFLDPREDSGGEEHGLDEGRGGPGLDGEGHGEGAEEAEGSDGFERELVGVGAGMESDLDF